MNNQRIQKQQQALEKSKAAAALLNPLDFLSCVICLYTCIIYTQATQCVHRAHIDMEISATANSAPVLCARTSCRNHREWVLCIALKTA